MFPQVGYINLLAPLETNLGALEHMVSSILISNEISLNIWDKYRKIVLQKIEINVFIFTLS